ncbi:TonB-dependent receptor [Saprospiraceae bacterium]|nr:TonB-dependent receptor [Saprospiraceae bacterium]
MRIITTLFLILALFSQVSAQKITQTVRGSVVDKSTGQSLIGVSIAVVNVDGVGTVSGADGSFTLNNVPLGRQQFKFSYIGYNNLVTDGIIISSSRTADLNIALEPGVVIGDIQIVADGNASAPINGLATVSARSFSVEETERIPAGVNDMGRMALSFPGVQTGSNDTENDIIVRGNSSVGVLWRLEGMDIPNPNHFARPGTSGGGITAFSAQLLAKSDFYTGGMPAEFGNALSGAFDVRFRQGNKVDRQHRVRIGLLGLDFATEGPIKSGKSSYLVNYRYSTLGLLNSLGLELIGERVSNNFQDLSFNLAFDGKDESVKWTVFGVGGISEEHYSPKPSEEREIGRSNHWEDRYNDSNVGILGVTYKKIINDKSYIKGTTTLMSGFVGRTYDTLSIENDRYRYKTEEYLDTRLSTAWNYWYEFSPRWKLKAGTIVHGINYKFLKENRGRSNVSDITLENLSLDVNGGGTTFTGQVYGLAQYNPTARLQMNFGLHTMLLGLNTTTAVDPRLSMKYTISNRQKIGLAIGRHSQILPMAAYFYQPTDLLSSIVEKPNFDTPMMTADHYILSYTFVSQRLIKFNAEVYYQRLSNVPIRKEDIGDGYWMLNQQAEFPTFDVTSDGKGENYGVDLSLEKFFSNKIYFLLTGSFFESNSILGDGTKHPTRFSTKWVSSFTLGKEIEFKGGGALQFGARFMYNGGYRYTPYDPILSAEAGRYVPQENAFWASQVTPYSRVDSRISYRFNKKRYSGSINLDIQNLTNKKNLNGVAYNAETNELDFRRFDGGDFIPVLSFVVDF